jgi:hypothetical protein
MPATASAAAPPAAASRIVITPRHDLNRPTAPLTRSEARKSQISAHQTIGT